jgi:hypothetical protein
MKGTEAARRIKAIAPAAQMMILTIHVERPIARMQPTRAPVYQDEMQARLALILGVLLASQATRTPALQDGCSERQKAHKRAAFLQESTI